MKGDLSGAVTVLDTVIRTNLEQQRIPGAAVALVHEGRVIFSRCYGYVDTKKVFQLHKTHISWPAP